MVIKDKCDKCKRFKELKYIFKDTHGTTYLCTRCFNKQKGGTDDNKQND